MGLRNLMGGAVLAVVAFAPLSGAVAAPQMLGLTVASATPLHCADGVCSAEFSAICLQEKRKMPRPGARYAALDPERIILHVRKADGSTVRMAGGALIRINTARAHFAVTISVPEAAKKTLGATRLAVSIGRDVTLVPVVTTADSANYSLREIAHARRVLRPAARDLIDGKNEDAVSARILNKLINGSRDTAMRREGLWERTVGAKHKLDTKVPGVQTAAKNYKMCQTMPRTKGFFRSCLKLFHDGHMSRLNLRYWSVVGAGS